MKAMSVAGLVPAGDQHIKLAQANVAQQSNHNHSRPWKPSDDRDNGFAQCRFARLRISSRSLRAAAVICLALNLRQHFVDEDVSIGKGIRKDTRASRPRAGGAHVRPPRCCKQLSDCKTGVPQPACVSPEDRDRTEIASLTLLTSRHSLAEWDPPRSMA